MSENIHPPSRVITVTKDDSLVTARMRMDTYKIRHLPVIDNKEKLIGIITDRDLRNAKPWSGDKNADYEKKLW